MEAIKHYPVIESHDVQNDASEVIDEYQHRDPDEGTSTFAVHQSASEIKVHNNSGYTLCIYCPSFSLYLCSLQKLENNLNCHNHQFFSINCLPLRK